MAEETLVPHIEKWAHLLPNQHCSLEVTPVGSHRWLNPQGQFHRVDENGHQDGPAVIYLKGSQVWLLNDKRHRLDGPAWIGSMGNLRWFLDGEKLTQEQWAADPRVIEFHSRTQQGAEEWLARL